MKDPSKPGLPPGGGLRIFTAVLMIGGGRNDERGLNFTSTTGGAVRDPV